MSGLGYKLFAAGEVLTAANLQGYAVDQSVMVFASSAARTTALAAPDQGMTSFLSDTGVTEQYFNLYNVSTNPGGRTPAGWYPVSPGGSGKPYQVQVGSGTTSASAQVTVTFTAGRFSVAPRVIPSIINAALVSVPYITTISSSSFAIGCFSLGGARSADTFHYIAVQMTPLAANG
jgi:hypothetical protein